MIGFGALCLLSSYDDFSERAEAANSAAKKKKYKYIASNNRTLKGDCKKDQGEEKNLGA